MSQESLCDYVILGPFIRAWLAGQAGSVSGSLSIGYWHLTCRPGNYVENPRQKAEGYNNYDCTCNKTVTPYDGVCVHAHKPVTLFLNDLTVLTPVQICNQNWKENENLNRLEYSKVSKKQISKFLMIWDFFSWQYALVVLIISKLINKNQTGMSKWSVNTQYAHRNCYYWSKKCSHQVWESYVETSTMGVFTVSGWGHAWNVKENTDESSILKISKIRGLMFFRTTSFSCAEFQEVSTKIELKNFKMDMVNKGPTKHIFDEI